MIAFFAGFIILFASKADPAQDRLDGVRGVHGGHEQYRRGSPAGFHTPLQTVRVTGWGLSERTPENVVGGVARARHLVALVRYIVNL